MGDGFTLLHLLLIVKNIDRLVDRIKTVPRSTQQQDA
jgi:hypothetical protein